MNRILLVVLSLSLLGGCYTLKARLPGALRGDIDDEVVIVGQFDHTITNVYLFDGLLLAPPETLFQAPLLAAVKKAEGDGVANMVLEAYFSTADIALSTITLGIAAPRTYRLRADIVRINAPALVGRPLLNAKSVGP